MVKKTETAETTDAKTTEGENVLLVRNDGYQFYTSAVEAKQYIDEGLAKPVK